MKHFELTEGFNGEPQTMTEDKILELIGDMEIEVEELRAFVEGDPMYFDADDPNYETCTGHYTIELVDAKPTRKKTKKKVA